MTTRKPESCPQLPGFVISGDRSDACGIIQFRSKTKGASAAAFNALAEGLACLSFCPGGARFLVLDWEARTAVE